MAKIISFSIVIFISFTVCCSLAGLHEADAEETGSLEVVIVPQAAIDGGAQWRVDGGAWHDSGYIQQLPVGQHTVEFNNVSGCIKPSNQTVTITEGQTTHVTEIYCDCTPAVLIVTIHPQVAIDAGAQWRVDGGAWQVSGYTQWVSVGQHLVEFSDVSGGWTKPASQWVTTTFGQTASIIGRYTLCDASLVAIIIPQGAIDAGAKWRRVGASTWQGSGDTEGFVPCGSLVIEFSDIAGWTKPSNQTVTTNGGTTTFAWGTYVPLPGSLQVTISPQAAIDAEAQWRRVGTDTWLDSGATETGIAVGQQIVEFSNVSGWTKPSNQTVTINNDATTATVGNYKLYTASFPFFDDFSTDQGWSGYELGGWERGPVLKGHAERGYSDPASDHSLNEDNFVLGFAIGGNYPNGISETKWIISPPIDCTGQEQVFLKFWRYLNVQGNKADHAAIYVSKDGTDFYRVWENPRSFVSDSHWVRKVYDISAIAANQATVYIAFGMGPTNSSGQFSGWNIDDVEVTSWYSISGFVRDRAGTPIPDVEVCFTDEFAYQIRPCVVSDEYGYYVQYGFEPYSLTKSYVYIVPSGPEFYFSPFRKKVKVINADIKVNFRAFSPIRQLGGE